MVADLKIKKGGRTIDYIIVAVHGETHPLNNIPTTTCVCVQTDQFFDNGGRGPSPKGWILLHTDTANCSVRLCSSVNVNVAVLCEVQFFQKDA
jgi:hypothetical protein